MFRSAVLCVAFALPCAALAAEGSAGPAFIAVSVADLDSAVAWYSRTLDLEVTRLPGSDLAQAALLRGRHVIVELIRHRDGFDLEPRVPDAGKRYLVHGLFKAGFFVDDLDAAIASLRSRGAEFKGEAFTDTVLGVRSILLLDPDGNILQLFQWQRGE